MKRFGSDNFEEPSTSFIFVGMVSKIEPSGFEFSKPSLNNMQTFYETNPTSINGKTKRHPLTKIITDVVYKEKK